MFQEIELNFILSLSLVYGGHFEQAELVDGHLQVAVYIFLAGHFSLRLIIYYFKTAVGVLVYPVHYSGQGMLSRRFWGRQSQTQIWIPYPPHCNSTADCFCKIFQKGNSFFVINGFGRRIQRPASIGSFFCSQIVRKKSTIWSRVGVGGLFET